MTSVHKLVNTPPWEWPEDAAESLAIVLQNPKQPLDDRILAARLAGDLVVMNDSLAKVLLALLGDPDSPEKLRATAAISFGPVLEEGDEDDDFDDPDLGPTLSSAVFKQIQPALRKIINDTDAPKIVRRRALEASVRFPADWHKPIIRFSADSPDDDWRLTAAFAMKYVRGFEKDIVKLVSDPNPEIKAEALKAAGNWDVNQVWPQVVKLLKSSTTPKPLLLAAIQAAAIRPEEATSLLSKYADSDDEDIAEAAEEALLMAGIDDDFDDDEL